MVGVGFFAGVNATSPDVVNVADTYYKNYELMDFKIISTMGLTDADVAILQQLYNVQLVVPSYSLDVQSRGNAIRIHSIENNVNIVKLTSGLMPESDKECLADSRTYMIGDKIEITDNMDDKLINTEFTVVGLIDSVLYINNDYGSTSIGNGKLASFIFINKNNFILEAYTEIYIIAQTDNADAYSNQYNSIVAMLNEKIVEIKSDRENARYDEIYFEAMTKINDSEVELKNEQTKAEKEFSDAKKTLDDSALKLYQGKNELAENEATLEGIVNTKNAEFDLAKQLIADGWQKIDDGLSEAGITKESIDFHIDELTLAITYLQLQLENYPTDSPEYVDIYATLMEYFGKLNSLEQLKTSINVLNAQELELNNGINLFNAEIDKARNEILNAKNEIITNEKKLRDGYTEYNKNLAEFKTEIADATKKINDAKQELFDLDYPKWYIYDRDTVIGYTELDNVIKIINAIAAVLPFFFILISMLMTSNSMARMITEERNEIGTLTSLGYKDSDIILTYLFYVLSATGIGAIVGFFIGCRIIPPLIYSNFIYILPPLVLEYNLRTLIIAIAITFVLMISVTTVVCNKELKQKPAYLMRPLPPARGQRIFLEKIGLIWKRMSFTWKVTMRNMFRYKKRALMTVIGVAGCAALLVTAFGIHDGMTGVAEKQYGGILRYDEMIILKDEVSTIDGGLKELLDKEAIINPLLLKQNAYSCEQAGRSLDFYMIVPQNNELFNEYFNLESTLDKQHISLDDDSIIITQRIAKVYNLKNGDILTIKDLDNNNYNLTVTDIAENYVSNYIYMNTSTYSEVFDETATFNVIVANSATDETMLAEQLINNELVVNVVFTGDALNTVFDSTQRLSGVIALVIIIASLLTIVVLYNLTSINISERTREIATLKVLGFRDGETNSYIYREALILTVISMGVGVVAGIALHHYLIDVIENGALSLFKNIKLFSYVAACILTLVFSVFMQIVTYFKLKKIDMIESLKSVE